MKKRTQFNKLIYDDLIERFNRFLGNNSKTFKGRDKESQAANVVFEAGLDVCEKVDLSEKQNSKKNDN